MVSGAEYAFKAISNEGFTALGLCGAACAVVVTQRKVVDKLFDASTVTNLFMLTPIIGAVATGLPADARALVARARGEAAEFRYTFGHAISVDLLARRLANGNQLRTQQAAMRPFGVALTLIGMDRLDDGRVVPQVYKCDPAGFYTSYTGTVSGPKAIDGMGALEKRLDADGSTHFGATLDETVECAISTLATLLGQEFKGMDIEVGVVSEASPRFRTLSVDEIEAHLTRLSERD